MTDIIRWKVTVRPGYSNSECARSSGRTLQEAWDYALSLPVVETVLIERVVEHCTPQPWDKTT